MNDISNEHKNYLNKIKKRALTIRLCSVALLIIFFFLWEILGRLEVIDPFLTSTPSRMLKNFIDLYNEGVIFKHILITTGETVIGFLLGTILGTFIAILLWWSDFACKVLDPYLVVLNALPKVALAPIIIFWVGNGIKAIIVIALLISIVVTIIGVLSGFKEVDEDKVKLMKTLGASKLQILFHLIIPSSIPTLVSALKINVGLSWVGVIMGEFLVAKNGLGFLIVFGGQISQLDMVMLSIVILALIAYLMYKLISILEQKIKINKY